MSSIDTNKLGNVDLNAPAFGPGAQTLKDLKPADTSVEEKPEIKEETEEEEDSEPAGDYKISPSRVKNLIRRTHEAEEEAEKWRKQAEELEQKPSKREVEETGDMPSYWKELYGDSEASQKAWSIQQRREDEIERRAYEAGQRGAEELEVKQQKRIEGNIATIDDNFEMLSDLVGRNLTAKEESAILDIVDDFTPKDEYGRYAGPLIPFEKAWEMYELKQGSAKQSQRKDRDSVASLSGTSSQGNTEINTEQDKNFNPLERGTWRKRLGL